MYNIYHVINGHEIETPLLETQVFERVNQLQLLDNSVNGGVMIISPLRNAFNKFFKQRLKDLRHKYPGIKIISIYGINRLGNFPANQYVALKCLFNTQTILHFRGPNHLMGISTALKKIKISTAKTVLDIRGLLYLEPFAKLNKFSFSELSHQEKKQYLVGKETLMMNCLRADAVWTVSLPLKHILTSLCNKDVKVIPCTPLDKTELGSRRKEIREQLGISDEAICLVYLGGTQKYQHLDDLVIPLMKEALELSHRFIAVFISHKKEELLKMQENSGIDSKRVLNISLPQQEVSSYLHAFDFGLLLRAKSELNAVAQPVKFGEYLAAGLLPLVEEGTGNIAQILETIGAGFIVNSQTNRKEILREIEAMSSDEINQRRSQVKQYVRQTYSLQALAPLELNYYKHLFYS